MGIPTHEKQPSESYVIAFEYSAELTKLGTTLLSGVVSAIDLSTNSSDTSIIGSTIATVSGTQGKVLLQAGRAGKIYKVTFTMTCANSAVLEDDLIVSVIER